MDTGEDIPDKTETQEYSTYSYVETAKNETTKSNTDISRDYNSTGNEDMEVIHNLLSGRINAADFNSNHSHNKPDSRLQQIKEAMGDRLIIASIPKPQAENPTKGWKI